MAIGDLAHFAGVGGAQRGQASPIARAKVVRAPASVADALVAELDGYFVAYPFTVISGHWQPNGAHLPQLGDECLVVFDDRDAWVVGWPAPATGGGAGASALVFTQATAQTVWTINHGFGRYPAAVSLYDNTGAQRMATITNPTVNQLVATFAAPQSGSAVLI